LGQKCKMHKFTSNQEYYAHLDTLAESLNRAGYPDPAQRLSSLLHKEWWNSTTELFPELQNLLIGILKQHGSKLPAHICDDLTACAQVIEDL
jgi:hypothetical protein